MYNEIINRRLGELRSAMKRENIDYCLLVTADFHASEYVCDFFKVREYFSGFNGSNGDLLVWKDGAALWTDGRYFLQAADQLIGCAFIAIYKSNIFRQQCPQGVLKVVEMGTAKHQ